MFCKNCGKEIQDGSTFCPSCGQQVIKELPQETNIEIKDKKVKEVHNEGKKKNKMGISIAIIVSLLVVAVIGVRMIKSSDSNKNEQITESSKKDDNQSKKSENIEMAWKDGDVPTEVGDGDSVAKILDTKIVDSSFGNLLVMSFEYTNNSSDASNFANEDNCRVQPFQNGIALDSPGYTSEEGVYDSDDAYVSVKDGGVIKTQLAWVLRDNVSSIEIEFGTNEDYAPDFIKTIELSGGTKPEDSEKELTQSDYKITLNGELPEKIGNDNEQAIIKNVAVIDSGEYGKVLVIDIDYINKLEDSGNLINSWECSISAYQSGIELDTPGVTSDSGYFDYNDAFTLVKKGGKISTQLVWSLNDDSQIDLELGRDDDYNIQYQTSLTFKK